MAKDGISQFMVNDSPFMDAVDDVVETLLSKEGPNEEDNTGDDESGDNAGDGEEDELGDDGGGEAEDGESDSEEDEEDSDEENEEEEEDEEVASATSYRATLPDGKQIDVSDETTLKLKVDGKFERVSVKDLTSEYNGRIKYDEQIRRASEEKKALEQQLSISQSQTAKAKQLTKAFMEGITKGDLIEAMAIVGEMTDSNEDPEKVLNDALIGIGKAIDELTNTDPEEIRRRARAYKLDVETKKKESKLKEYERQEAVKAAKLEKEQLKEEHGLTEEEMKASFDALEVRNQKLVQQGKQPIDFSLTDVATLATEYKHYSAINEIASTHSLELKDGDVNYLVSVAALKARNEGRKLSKKDYVQLLSSHVNKELKNLSRKVGPSKTTPKSKSKNKSEVKDIKRVSQIWD